MYLLVLVDRGWLSLRDGQRWNLVVWTASRIWVLVIAISKGHADLLDYWFEAGLSYIFICLGYQGHMKASLFPLIYIGPIYTRSQFCVQVNNYWDYSLFNRQMCLLILYLWLMSLLGTIVGLVSIGPLVTPTWNSLCWCSLSITLVWF